MVFLLELSLILPVVMGLREENKARNKKDVDGDGAHFTTLCASLDGNYGHIYSSHIHVGGDAYGVD